MLNSDVVWCVDAEETADSVKGMSVLGFWGSNSLSRFSEDPCGESSSGESLSSTSATSNFRCVDGVTATTVVVFGTLLAVFGTLLLVPGRSGSTTIGQTGSETEQTCRPLWFVAVPVVDREDVDVLLGSLCEAVMPPRGEEVWTGVEA